MVIIFRQYTGNRPLDFCLACNGRGFVLRSAVARRIFRDSGNRRRDIILILGDHLKNFKGITRHTERRWSLLLTHTEHEHSRFAQPLCQLRKVGIRGDQAEALHISGIENVHRIDDHRGVGRVLSVRIAVLLDRVDRVA